MLCGGDTVRYGLIDALIVIAAFLALASLLVVANPGHCDWCVATFCGSSADCPGDCVCAIPWGEVTGSCSGSN